MTDSLQKNQPFSDKIIFFDTEFTTLDPKVGELLSIGMVKSTGQELYLELEATGEMDPWVTTHVLPNLKQQPVTQEEARRLLTDFLGPDKPFLVSYVNQFDAVYWYKLFGSPKEHPAFWIPIDFASMLFAYGIDPNSFGKEKFFTALDINKSQFQLHNALDDARLLALVYKRLVERGI